MVFKDIKLIRNYIPKQPAVGCRLEKKGAFVSLYPVYAITVNKDTMKITSIYRMIFICEHNFQGFTKLYVADYERGFNERTPYLCTDREGMTSNDWDIQCDDIGVHLTSENPQSKGYDIIYFSNDYASLDEVRKGIDARKMTHTKKNTVVESEVVVL